MRQLKACVRIRARCIRTCGRTLLCVDPFAHADTRGMALWEVPTRGAFLLRNRPVRAKRRTTSVLKVSLGSVPWYTQIAVFLVQVVIAHGVLQGVSRWVLAGDAGGDPDVLARAGFRPGQQVLLTNIRRRQPDTNDEDDDEPPVPSHWSSAD